MAVEVKIEGIEELTEKLEGMVSLARLRTAVGKACAIVERSAKQKTQSHRDTGELSRSITSKIEGEGTHLIGIIYTPLEYAPYVEFGTGLFAEKGGRTDVPWHYQDEKGEWHTTSGQKPQPFLRPALNENREEIKRILRGAMITDG